MADAMHTTVHGMERVAQGILSERSSSNTSSKKRRPIPVPPSSAAAPQKTGKPDPAVRRKRRPIPATPSAQEPAEANSKV